MKYSSVTVRERVEALVREEVNIPTEGILFEDFINQFIQNVTKRITALIQDEVKYGRK